MLVNRVSLDRLRLHVQVPDFEWEVVACQQVAAVVTKLYIGYTRDYFGEEASIGRVFGFLQHYTYRNNKYADTFYNMTHCSMQCNTVNRP